jgi:HSP20 family protein
MADPRTNRPEGGKESGQTLARRDRESRGLQRREPSGFLGSPFELMDRMTEEMDRVFDRISRDFGFPRLSWPSRGFFESPTRRAAGTIGREGAWLPRVEAFQKGDRFIVRAELPGLKKEDVQVDIADEALTIHGERREEREEEREGSFFSEREYGQFNRTIPLPEGVIAETAEAAFRNGVLEVTMQAAPSEANRGRRLEIKEGAAEEQKG